MPGLTKSVAVFSASGLYAVVESRAAAARLTGVTSTNISASILQQAPGAQSAAGYARSGAPLLRKGTPPPSQEPGKGSTSDWSREPMQMFAFTDSHITVKEFEAKKADVGVADLIEDLPEDICKHLRKQLVVRPRAAKDVGPMHQFSLRTPKERRRTTRHLVRRAR
jgi:hypothetical protein